MNEDERRKATYDAVGYDAAMMRSRAHWVSEQALDWLVGYYARNLDSELAMLLDGGSA
jgi:hypothetical protein